MPLFNEIPEDDDKIRLDALNKDLALMPYLNDLYTFDSKEFFKTRTHLLTAEPAIRANASSPQSSFTEALDTFLLSKVDLLAKISPSNALKFVVEGLDHYKKNSDMTQKLYRLGIDSLLEKKDQPMAVRSVKKDELPALYTLLSRINDDETLPALLKEDAAFCALKYSDNYVAARNPQIACTLLRMAEERLFDNLGDIPAKIKKIEGLSDKLGEGDVTNLTEALNLQSKLMTSAIAPIPEKESKKVRGM